MFWLRRMKQDPGDDRSWAVPYGDMMGLLLACFVMIAAMSELRAGERFDAVGSALRSAFGFAPTVASAAELDDRSSPRRLTLIDRLEQAGFGVPGPDSVRGNDEAALADCDVVTEPDRLVVRVAGPVSFGRFSAQLEPPGRQAVARLASYLAGGQARLEIRGHAGDGEIPASTLFHDALDLSYARARAVVHELQAGGVPGERICVTAWGDGDPLTAHPEAVSAGANRRVEIVVHGAVTASGARAIAEKGQVEDG